MRFRVTRHPGIFVTAVAVAGLGFSSIAAADSRPAGVFPGDIPSGYTGPVTTVLPPAGSTQTGPSLDGSPAYHLPPGATGLQISGSGGSVPSTIQSTAIYPTAAAQSLRAARRVARGRPPKAHAAASWTCDQYAQAPRNAGSSQVYGVASLTCYGTGVDSVYTLATLYWWSGSSWVWQGNRSASGHMSAKATYYHHCTAGTTHSWHTRNDSNATINGTLVGFPGLNSSNASLYCF